jgi:hypothetical protein
MKKIILFCAILAAFTACKNQTPQAAAPEEQPESVAGISLDFRSLGEDKNGTPHSEIILGENGGAEAIDTIAGSCNAIPKTDYAKMGIPAEAVAACGAWYAGGGDYFYVLSKDNSGIVFQGYQEEQQTDEGYHWKQKALKRN